MCSVHSEGGGLVDAARAGDGAASRAIYDELAPKIAGYLRSHGAEDPEGLTSEVFLTVFRHIATLTEGMTGLRKFAFTVARARLIDELRSRARRPHLHPYDADLDVHSVPSAEDDAIQRISGREALALLAELSDGQREVVALRVISGLSLQETAQVTGRSIGAVKQLQRRGLLALKEIATLRGVTP